MKTDTKTHPAFPVVQIGRYVLPLIVLGIAVHVLVPQLTNLEHSLNVLRQMAWWAVALAIIAQVLSYYGSGYLLKTIVQLSNQNFSVLRATMIVLAAGSLGTIAGGMVGSAAATFRWMEKEGVKPESAGLAGTIPGFFNSSVLVLVSLAGLIHLLIVHQLSRLQVISFVLLLVILGGLAGVFLWGYRHQTRLSQIARRLGERWSKLLKRDYSPEKIDTWLRDLFTTWEVLIRGGWRGPMIGAALNILFDMLTLFFLFMAAGHPASPGILLTGYGLPLLLGRMAFIVPGGVGVVEGTMVALYDGLGIPDAVTVVVVLAYRILSFWLPLIFGFPMILLLQKSKEVGST